MLRGRELARCQRPDCARARGQGGPDGYTLLMANLGPNAINPAVYCKLPYDPIKDFTPITRDLGGTAVVGPACSR